MEFVILAAHQNRSRAKSPASNPTPEQFVAARLKVGLTQEQTAKKLFASVRAVQHWESGSRRIHPAIFDYFLLITGQKKLTISTVNASSTNQP